MTDAIPPSKRKDPQAIRARVEKLEVLLERMFTVPGINQPVGLDAMLSLIPGVGTVSAAALGSYIAWEARNLGLPKWKMARMSLNIGFDMLLGAIPVVGVVPDFFFRSNSRNLRIIRKHLDKHHPLEPAS
ncbi:DUF4112 domain-containing protein [Sphingomicrobium clamense]|uniref:DUF4112 domain-containing protein n=1 Tax=Sphingomicrobium clamense TaxID=2851013 RepID=A0ABS6V4X3_9SPHN|nr:DUF4112 domain-containing protein [Sphingomicrobium sp. B8]MBW0144598.1 DUF4112 domain-containing protein [Sphingomicrobium sp. B8]